MKNAMDIHKPQLTCVAFYPTIDPRQNRVRRVEIHQVAAC
jgi:hypothetical protein